MNITYLGHAGFCVETVNATVIIDPWLSSSGAYDSAWFQFPCNHHLAEYVQAKLADASKARYVYISHEHKDHFDPEFLNSLRSRDFKLIVPKFRRPALYQALSGYRCDEVVACADEQELAIPAGLLKVYLVDTELNRDSTILIKADGCSFLDVNDCKIYDRLAAIADEEDPIDALAAQFSGATWHPTCYDYSREVYESVSRAKMLGKFETVARSIETVRPRLFLPSAGPPCFLDPALWSLNFEPVNIFPRTRTFTRFLDRRLNGLSTLWPEIMPGDVLDAESGRFVVRAEERVADANFEPYVKAYAAAHASRFAALRAELQPLDAACLMERLRRELERKLARFILHDRICVPLYFGFSDFEGKMLRLRFPARSVEQVSGISDAHYYSIVAPAWQVRRVLDGDLTWEDFSLTFRMRLKREPDAYQTLIQGFLILESEDLLHFCEKILETESKNRRFIVEANGRRYAVDRLCPHQGADLREGWIHDERYLVCARHGWQFDLTNNGRCTTNETSVNAVGLDEDSPRPETVRANSVTER